ncbi:MAG: hypothetical protein JRJ85_05340 [Deltaproteobacteria bacterium]|nr:hypothetical protein [Deltaproteobacteria bacterium]
MATVKEILSKVERAAVLFRSLKEEPSKEKAQELGRIGRDLEKIFGVIGEWYKWLYSKKEAERRGGMKKIGKAFQVEEPGDAVPRPV